MERQAGAELRDAATKGLVRKDELCDVSQLKGSSTREKGGQRGSKHARASNTGDEAAQGNDQSEGEDDLKPSPKKRKTARQELLDTLKNTRQETESMVRDAQKMDIEHHEELRESVNGMTTAVASLTEALDRDRQARHEEFASIVSVVKALAEQKDK